MSIGGINNNNPVEVQTLQKVQRNPAELGHWRKKVHQEVRKDEDTVQISERSREFARIRKLVDSQPDVRLEKVHRLASEIDKGTYQVSGKNIADAVIRKHLRALHS